MMRALSLAAASAALAAVLLLAHPKRWRMVMMLRVGLTTATKSSWSGRNHAKDALRTGMPWRFRVRHATLTGRITEYLTLLAPKRRLPTCARCPSGSRRG